MSSANKLKQTALMLLVATTVVTIVVTGILPAPFGPALDRVAFIAEIFLLSAAGPLNFPFFRSVSSLNLTTAVVLAIFFIVPALLYYLWYTRKQAIVMLGTCSILWAGFGGFSVFMGIAAGI